jgi:NIMA-interacting peptidyl-prolyl cis-trans isomerase 1
MRIRCAHILQKHRESRRPVDSFRNKQITRTKEEALANIEAFLQQVKAKPESFM